MSRKRSIRTALILTPDDEAMIERRGYHIGKQISGGQYGSVYECSFQTYTLCAVKVILMQELDANCRHHLPRELFMLRTLRHPYIVTLYDIAVVTTPPRLMIFMEYSRGGDMFDMMNQREWLPEVDARYYFAQIGDAVQFLHSVGVAHRDIKLENILMDSEQRHCKLTDFGFARFFFSPITREEVFSHSLCGTRLYMDPTLLLSYCENVPPTYRPDKADIWATGVLLFYLVNGVFPFYNTLRGTDCIRLLYRNAAMGKFRYARRLTRECRDVIEKMLEPDPIQRLPMCMILRRQWFVIDLDNVDVVGSGSSSGGSTNPTTTSLDDDKHKPRFKSSTPLPVDSTPSTSEVEQRMPPQMARPSQQQPPPPPPPPSPGGRDRRYSM